MTEPDRLSARSLVFAHLVNRALDRAFLAAEALERDHPGLTAVVHPSGDNAFLYEDPDQLPELFFGFSSPDGEEDGVHLSMGLTAGGMVRELKDRVVDLMAMSREPEGKPTP